MTLINGTNRADRLSGGSGDDTINGRGGNDIIDGGGGNDVIDGGAGTDIIAGGSGNDTLDGGSGSDLVDGGSGSDTLVYRRAGNLRDVDIYTGGSGIDTLRLELTAAEYARADVRGDITRFLTFIAARTGGNGQADATPFAFRSSSLVASGFERLEVYVDGVLVTPGGDTTPPPAPTLLLAAGSDTGVTGDLLTSDTTPTLTGTAEANATVTILRNGAVLGTTTASAAGQWSFTPAALVDGPHSFTATATDTAGNVSAASAVLVLTIDTVLPVAPILDLAQADDTGVSDTDDLTRNGTVTINVAAEDGSTVSLAGQSAVAIGGGATFSVALAEGQNTLSATATDPAGNVRAAGTLVITRDSTADLGGDLAVSLGVAVINTAGRGAVPFEVTGLDADATAVVTFTSSGGGSLVRTIAANGSFTADLAGLADGTLTASITASDPAGNSATGISATALIDTLPPAAPVLDLAASDDTGISDADDLTRNSVATITVAAESGSTVALGGQSAVAVGGIATFSVALQEGLNTLAATATDAAGNTSDAGTLVVMRDSTADAGGDLTISLGDSLVGASERTAVPFTVAGLDADATAVLSFVSSGGGSVLQSVAVNGTFTADLSALADGTVTATLVATDRAGNTASATASTALDTVAPSAPVLDLAAADDTGSSSEDNLTRNGLVTVYVTAEEGSTVTLGSQTAIATGGVASFSVALAEGLNALTATTADAAGNISAAGTLAITRDSLAPAAPSITLDPASDTGTAGDGTTSDTTPTLMGFAEAGATVTVLENGSPIGTTTAEAGTGAWSFTTTTLAAGPRSFSATATDAAGNLSAVSAALPITIETGQPTPIAFALAASDEASAPGDNTTTGSLVALVGATVPGAVVAIAGGPTTIADNHGAFRLTEVPLNLGTQTVTLTVTPAGGAPATADLVLERVAAPAGGNEVIQWIREALETIAEESAAPTYASRALAMESLAVYNVVAAINGTPGYQFAGQAAAGASVDAAIAQAAHDVLLALFPAQKGDLDLALANSLLAIADGQPETDGIALGQTVAAELLASRAGDGWNTIVTDVGSHAPGQWEPTPVFYAPGLDAQWGSLDTFALTSADQFRPGAPPALDSQAFIDAFNEVKAIGASDSTTRTAEQTQIARFWAAGIGTNTPPGMWNDIALTIADGRDIGAAETARLFATLNVALADSGIATWNTKYTYDFWRPVTAIRDAADLANPALEADSDWLPLIPTPNFPEYVSGHSTYSAAAATVLTDFFGPDTTFTVTSGSLRGVQRTYTSFWDAANEAGMSRVYGGIHFSFSNTAGLAAGQQIGNWALNFFDTAADSIGPAIRIDQPAGFVTDTPPTITGSVHDNLTGVARLLYSLNGSGLTELTLGTDGRFSLPLTAALSGAADGRQHLAIYARDAAGNTSSIADYGFTLAAANPTLTLAADGVQPGETVAAGDHLKGAIGLVAGNSLTSLTVAFDGGARQAVAFSDSLAFDQPLDLRTLATGTHTLTLEAADAAGNVTTQTFTIEVPVLPFTVTDITPAANEMMIGVTTRPMVTFSRPVDPLTLTASSFYATDGGGALIPATIVPFADGLGAWLLFNNPLPGSTAVTLHLEGSEIRSLDGTFLDAGGTGAAGGSTLIETFTTVSRDSVPGTVITGIVVDPGPDNEMMTPDDVRGGPGGLNDFANNTWTNPLAGVKVYILGQEERFVLTDANGRFTLSDVPVGNVKIAVDGRAATNAPAGTFFPEMVMDATIRPGVVNTVMGSMGPIDAQKANIDNPAVYLPRLDSAMLQSISATATTIVQAVQAPNNALTGEQLSLIALKVAPGSLIDEDGNPVANAQVGLSPVPPSMVMDMLPPGVLQHAFDITIQAPGAAVFTTPAELTLPNVFGLAPGEKAYVMSFDHTSGRLVINGTATVSADGLTVTTDPGAGIVAPGWHGIAPRGSQGEGAVTMACAQPKHLAWEAIGATDTTLASKAQTGWGVIGDINSTLGALGIESTGKLGFARGAIDYTNIQLHGLDAATSLGNLATAASNGDLEGVAGYGAESFVNSTIVGFDIAGALGGNSAPGRLANGLGLAVGKAKTFGEWLAQDYTSNYYLPSDFQARVDQYNSAKNLAGWIPPPGTESTAQARIDEFFALHERVMAEAARQQPILERLNQTRTDFIRFIETVDPQNPVPGINNLGPTPQERGDAVNRAGDFVDDLIDLVSDPNYEDLGNLWDQLTDAMAAATNAMNDALGMDLDMPMTDPGLGNITEIVEVQTIQYGPVFYYVLENLETGDELRGQFDPFVPFRPFLEADADYQLTVFDPVSRQVGRVFFTSEGNGQTTEIPDILMLPDTTAVGAGGFTATAAHVLGINPSIPDNFVPGITDSTALVTGLAESPALANTTGLVGSVALQGDAKAIIIESDGANSAMQTAYVATGSHGLAIVDVTNPRAPVVLSQLDLAGDASDVAYSRTANIAAVALGTAIAIVDVSVPTAPRLLHSVNATATQVEIVGGTLYYATGGALIAYDLAARSIASSVLLGSTAAVTGLATDGTHLYVMQGNTSATSAFTVLDIADDTPAITGTLSIAAAAYPNDGRLISRDNPITVNDGIVYLPTSRADASPSARIGGFATIDVSDPSAPLLISDADTTGIMSEGFALNGSGRAIGVNRVRVDATDQYVLDIIRTTDPSDTGALVNRIVLPGTATPFDAAIAGGNAFIATDEGLQVVQYLTPDRAGVAPTVTVTSTIADVDPVRPGIQVYQGSSIDLGVRVTDDVQVRSVELLANGRSVATDLSVPIRVGTALPTIAENGGAAITLQVRATDTGGNIGLAAPIEVELVADQRPFNLVGVTPDFLDIASTLTRTVSYLFSKPLDPTTVSTANFILKDTQGNVIPATGISLSEDGTRVEVTYDALGAGRYIGTVRAAQVRDLAGTALGTVDFVGPADFTVQAFDNTWIGAPSGRWSITTNWSQGSIPDGTDSVLVNIPTGAEIRYDVSLGSGDRFGDLMVTGNGLLHVETGPFHRGINITGLRNSGTVQLDASTALTIEGSVHNTGRIALTATNNPVPFSPTGGASSMTLSGADVRLTGGGLIELLPSSLTNKPSLFISSVGSEPYGPGTISVSSLVTNVDNTIRGGGTLGGLGILVNEAAGIIESTLDTRLTLQAYRFGIADQFSFTVPELIDNRGTIRATASSTLEIKRARVENSGVLQADGANSLLFLTGTTSITGGTISAVGTSEPGGTAYVFIDVGRLSNTTLDVAQFGQARGLSDVTLANVNLRGEFLMTPLSSGRLGLNGAIDNQGSITAFSSAGTPLGIELLGNTTFTGGGALSIVDEGGALAFSTPSVEYPPHNDGEPAPPMPAPVVLTNVDNVMTLAGLYRGASGQVEFIDENFQSVLRPATAPLEIVNAGLGIIMSGHSVNGIAQPLTFDGVGFANGGRIIANAGVPLIMQNVTLANSLQQGATTLLGSLETAADNSILRLDNTSVTGGTISVNGAGSTLEIANDTLGTLAGASLVNIASTFIAEGNALRIRPNATLDISSTTGPSMSVTLDGTLDIQSSDLLAGRLTWGGQGGNLLNFTSISGTGQVLLETIDGSGTRSLIAGGAIRLDNVDLVGSGDVDAGLLILGPQSELRASSGGALNINAQVQIDAGTTVVESGEGVTAFNSQVNNQGLLIADGLGDSLVFNDIAVIDGALEARGGAKATFNGQTTGLGTFELADDSSFVFNAAFDARVEFNDADAAGNGTVTVGDTAGFTGHFAFFNAGDVIDLPTMDFATASTTSESFDGTFTTFTLNDGTDTATLRFEGDLQGQLQLASAAAGPGSWLIFA